MRALLVLAVLLALPALYLLYGDYGKYQQNPAQGFHLSTLGELWIEHDRAGFAEFKAGYKARPHEWENDVRPKLQWQALPFAVVPALAFYLFLLIAWLLGRGPFAGMSGFSGRGSGHNSGFSRASAQDRGSKISYRRK